MDYLLTYTQWGQIAPLPGREGTKSGREQVGATAAG